MRSSTWLPSWLCALVLAGVVSSAAAQGPAPAPAVQGDPPGYRELVDEAVAEHRAGHFGEARGLFARAHNLYPNARTLKGMGMAEFELRNYRESAQYLQASMASTVKPLTPELRAEAEQLLARAQRFLGRVRVLVSPPNTQITVDGAMAPFGADGSVLLTAGDHTLEATAIGHEPTHQMLKINGGDEHTITFQLKPISAPPDASLPPPAAASVASETAPEASGSPSKPRGFRLYFGGLLGFGGSQDFTFDVTRDDGASVAPEVGASQKVTYGFDVGATFFAIPFFDLGAEVRLSWAQAGDYDDNELGVAGPADSGRTLLVDIDAKPRIRLDLMQGRVELYLAVPVGLTIPSRPKEDDLDTSLGWNIGVGPGANFFLSNHVGLNLEFMFLFHSYSAEGAFYDDETGSTYSAEISLFAWQPSVLLNLVIAP